MSCGGGSSGTNTVTQNTAPPPQVLQAYSNLTNAAFNQAQQPLQQFTGSLVSGFTPQQTQGFQEVQNAQGMATPYINAAAQEFGQATTPFSSTVPTYLDQYAGNIGTQLPAIAGQYQGAVTSQIPAYESPYTGQVTDALQGLFSQQNAQQQQQVNSNATAQGAFGGDRGAVANALTAQQQNLSEAPTLANVLQGGYQSALQSATGGAGAGLQGAIGGYQTGLGAAEAGGYLGEQSGFGIGSLGSEAQNAALTGASAEESAGGLQQQLAQEELNIPYEQFQSAQAYPWQVLGELSPIVSGIGSASGGTGSTTYPGPSLVSQLGGLGIAGLGTYGLLNSTGALSGLSGLFGGGADAAGLAGAGALAGDTAVGAGLGDAALAGLPFGFRRGGRIGFADGGGIGTDSSALPVVPNPSLDHLVAPGPLTKGSGPPHAPQGSPEQYQGMNPLQEMQMFTGVDKMFNEAGIGAGSAFGGRTRHDDGGETPALMPSSTPLMSSSLAGLSPPMQGYAQKLQAMPLDQLQNMAIRVPPTSPYGAIVQKVLSMRRLSPGNTTNAVSSASGVPIGTGAGQPQGGIGGQQGGIGGGQSQQPSASGQMPPQGQGYAAGGGPIITDEPDMDQHPMVDHSGDTVVVHYPSEGKSLDLGIPSSKRRTLAAGGAGGTVTPGPATVIGNSGSSAQPFFSSVTAPNGIAIPQLSMDAFAVPGGGTMGPSPGGGLGSAQSNWENFLPQLSPYGTFGTWPQIAPSTPAIAALQGLEGGGRTRLQGGGDGDDEGVPGVAVAPDSQLVSGNGFGSPDLGPAAAVVTPAEGIVTPSPAPAPTSTAPPPPTTAPAVPAPAPKDDNGYDAEVRAHGETPQEGSAPVQSDFGSTPQGRTIAGRESGDRNIPNYRFDAGHTAGGHYQITDTNWQHYAPTVGIDLKQYPNALSAPEQLQGQVAGKMYDETGMMPWASSDPNRPRTAGTGPEDQIVGSRHGIGATDDGMTIQTSPSGGIGEPYGGGIGGAALGAPRISPTAAWAQSPWMIPIAIGAGMMSGRSSHPLVNVGQGMTEGVKTAEQQGEQGVRSTALENEATNRQAALGLENQRLQQTGQYQAGELAARQNEFERASKAEQDRFSVEMTNAKTAQARADAMDRHYENMDAINAGYKQMMMSKPLPGFEKDPNTGQITYGTHEFNPETGHFEFKPGAGEGRAPSTGNNTFAAKQQAWLALHPGDAQGALDFAGGQKQMTPEEVNRSAANLAQRQMSSDITAMSLSAPEQQQRLAQYERFWVGQIQGGGAAAHPAAAPAQQQQPAAVPAGPPPVPQALQGMQLRGWSPSTQKFYDMSGKAYDATGQPAQ